jgi:LCP family protein required for cell wall assembly
MEDGGGGLSVADLVQRHGISRQDQSAAHPVEAQPVRRPAEPTESPQWPEIGTQGSPHPEPPARRGGHHSVAGPQGFPSAGDYDPAEHFGTPPGGRADDGYGPGGGFVPGGHNGMADAGYAPGGMPDDGFGPGGLPGRVVPGPGGMADNGFGPGGPGRGMPDDGFGPAGRNGMADEGFGPGPGHRMPDAGYGPPDNGFGPSAPDNRFGPADNGFGQGPGGRGAPDDRFGPADNGYAPDDRFAPGDNGFGPGAAGRGVPDDGYGPADNGYGGFGPGAAPGHGAPDFGPGAADFGPGRPDEGFGQPGRRAVPGPGQTSGSYPVSGPGQTSGSYRIPGPGQASGSYPVPGPGQTSGTYAVPPGAGRGLPPGRPVTPDENFGGYRPDEGFGDFGPGAAPQPPGPGQGTGRRPMPPDGFGQGSGPRPVPGQGTGPRPIPGTGPRPIPGPGQNTGGPVFPGPGQATGGPVLPGPGQATGGPGLPPGQNTGRPVVPGPGQGTGHRPMPPDGFGPGQTSGYRAMPGNPDQALGGPPINASGPISRDQVLGRGDDRPPTPIPPTHAGSDERPGQRPPRPGERADDAVPLPPPRKPERDAISMTTEMEAIGEDVQKRRGIDHTLARFSAVHDEIQAEERVRKAKRRKLMPWRREDDEMEQLDELVAGQTLAAPIPGAQPVPAPENQLPLDEGDGRTRLQAKKSRRHDRSTLAIRVAAATAAILVFVATGVAWGFKSWVDASSQQVDALDPDSKDIQDAAKQRGDENFLLVGSDTRAGAEAEDGVGSEKEIVGARSDTVMVAHIPADRQRAVVVSFPRDLEVRRPACEGWDPKSGDYTGEQKPAADTVKLNTAYQVGGPKCVTKLVQQLSGLMINHFVGIDFHGFKGMVDAVRGVQVCVERPLKDDILGTVVPQGGKNVTLTGDQALNFVRARHVQGDLTSDYGRIKRQQRFLSSLLRKAMSSEVLLDPGKLSDFVEAFSKSTFGDNIGIDQMITLGQSLQGIQAGKVTFITVPTVGEANDNGNEELRADDNKSLFRAVREDTPLPGEKSGTQQLQTVKAAPANTDPKSIKVQVFNGGNPTGGIAGGTADQLAEYGYQIVWVDAAPENVKRTIIKYAKGSEAKARLLQSSVPDAELVEDPSLAGAIQLIIGPGFDGKVVAPGKGQPADQLPADLSTINGGDVSCA